MVWWDWDSHHAIEGEVEEGEVGNEEEPEEFGSCPLEAHHGVYDEGVVSCLDKHIGDLHDNLWKQNFSVSREQIASQLLLCFVKVLEYFFTWAMA